MRVSANSRPGSVAGAIVGKIRNGESVSLETIGAAALNQATKALIIASGFLAKSETLAMTARFKDFEVDGFRRTAIVMDLSILSDNSDHVVTVTYPEGDE